MLWELGFYIHHDPTPILLSNKHMKNITPTHGFYTEKKNSEIEVVNQILHHLGFSRRRRFLALTHEKYCDYLKGEICLKTGRDKGRRWEYHPQLWKLLCNAATWDFKSEWLFSSTFDRYLRYEPLTKHSTLLGWFPGDRSHSGQASHYDH